MGVPTAHAASDITTAASARLFTKSAVKRPQKTMPSITANESAQPTS